MMPSGRSDVAWQMECSVESIASVEFAWTYLADVTNWNDPPAQFRLEGSFVTGARGTTEIPGQLPRHWQLRDVHPVESYTIELFLDQATLSFVWRFRELPDGRARLTKHIILQGENSAANLAEVQQGFAPHLAAGMNRIAAMIDQAYIASQS